MDRTDEAAWQAVREGDDDAFAEVFRRHAQAVTTQLARRTGSYDAAEDLRTKVFLQAWESRDRVRFVDGSLRPWLLVTASNIAATHLRSHGRYLNMTRQLIPEIDVDIPFSGAEARLDAQALAPLLAAGISMLSDREQAVIALCDLAEYTYSEAAAALRLPVSTVKSRHLRAHRKLRVQLGEAAARALGLETPTSERKEPQS